MTLAQMIRKRQFRKSATATPATEEMNALPSVASVATVAVAITSNAAHSAAQTEIKSGDSVVEPASPTAQMVYWEEMDGNWHGPVRPEYLGRTGRGPNEQFWVIVNHEGTIRWISSDLLRSGQAFLASMGIGA